MQIRQITWDMDSEEEAFITETRNITNQGETFDGLGENYINNVDVGSMINFHMEFTINSEMKSYTTSNMQTIGEILYFKENTKPVIQNVELMPVSN
jgi:hypothetical protein